MPRRMNRCSLRTSSRWRCAATGQPYDVPTGEAVYAGSQVTFCPKQPGTYVVTPKLLPDAAGYDAVLAESVTVTVNKAGAPLAMQLDKETYAPGEQVMVTFTQPVAGCGRWPSGRSKLWATDGTTKTGSVP